MKYAEVVVDTKVRHLHKVFDYLIPTELEAVLKVGSKVRVPFGGRILQGYVLTIKAETEFTGKLRELISAEQIDYNAEQLYLANRLSEYYLNSKNDTLNLLEAYVPEKSEQNYIVALTNNYTDFLTSKAKKKQAVCAYVAANFKCTPQDVLISCQVKKPFLNAMVEQGILELQIEEKIVKKVSWQGLDITPTTEQEQAMKRLKKSLDEEIFRGFLLYGVTGSGKTEVFIELIGNTLKMGKQALVLVPEIFLTSNIFYRYQAYFTDNIGIWHSKISKKKKRELKDDLLNGKINLVIGTRSAVFLAFNALGLIIIDEEHDNSFEQTVYPRYHAKDVALWRSEYNQALLVLGSGTPSLESVKMVNDRKLELLMMKNRPNDYQEPKIKIVDMRKKGNEGLFSQELQQAMQKCLAQKEQILLFQNRRGYHTSYVCRSCGYVYKCSECDISLTLHYDSNKLICHYCGKEYQVAQRCPACDSQKIAGFGIGIEQVEEEARRLFPTAAIKRLDQDATAKIDDRLAIIAAYERQEINILIGTQMLARGLDFSNVALVAVISTDVLLNFPDFRAGERAYQMLKQVAGRSGRRGQDGLVLFQTHVPDNVVLELCKKQDMKAYYRHELARRARVAYPPFKSFCSVTFSAKDEEMIIHVAKLFSAIIHSLQENMPELDFMAPERAAVAKLRGVNRWQAFVRCQEEAELRMALSKALEMIYTHKDYKAKVLIDIEFNG